MGTCCPKEQKYERVTSKEDNKLNPIRDILGITNSSHAVFIQKANYPPLLEFSGSEYRMRHHGFQRMTNTSAFRFLGLSHPIVAFACIAASRRLNFNLTAAISDLDPDNYASSLFPTVTLWDLLCNDSSVPDIYYSIYYKGVPSETYHSLLAGDDTKVKSIELNLALREINRLPLEAENSHGFNITAYAIVVSVLNNLLARSSTPTFEEFCAEYIFKPFHMSTTGFNLVENMVYSFTDMTVMIPSRLDWVHTSYNIAGCISDYSKFIRGALDSEHKFAFMNTKFFDANHTFTCQTFGDHSRESFTSTTLALLAKHWVEGNKTLIMAENIRKDYNLFGSTGFVTQQGQNLIDLVAAL